ncbi:hypothetical protein CHUAL_002769 [Chamberlinius hualienensis]
MDILVFVGQFLSVIVSIFASNEDIWADSMLSSTPTYDKSNERTIWGTESAALPHVSQQLHLAPKSHTQTFLILEPLPLYPPLKFPVNNKFPCGHDNAKCDDSCPWMVYMLGLNRKIKVQGQECSTSTTVTCYHHKNNSGSVLRRTRTILNLFLVAICSFSTSRGTTAALGTSLTLCFST